MWHILLVLLAGCAQLQTHRKLSSIENPDCTQVCSAQEICMNTFTDRGAQCVTKPELASLPKLLLPVDKKTEVYCTHSVGVGSHSGENAFYALDLASDYTKPAAVIRAAASGEVFVFGDEKGGACQEPVGRPDKAQSSTCGNSWGNNIKIYHNNGYYSFYVHLDHAVVKTGDHVRQGQPIGVEGWSGAAGHRHLHWSIQKLPGNSEVEWRQRISWTGQSVPFQFEAMLNGKLQSIRSDRLVCPHAGVHGAPDQPVLSGVP